MVYLTLSCAPSLQSTNKTCYIHTLLTSNPEDEDFCVRVKLWLLTNQATHNHNPEDSDLNVFLLCVARASVD